MRNWLQLHDFHHNWEKNYLVVHLRYLDFGLLQAFWDSSYWDFWKNKICCKPLWITTGHNKTAYFSIFRIFQLLKFLKKKICCKPLWICVKLVTTTWFSPPLRKKLHGNTLRYTYTEIQWFCLKQLKAAYFKHIEHFQAIEIFAKKFQTKFCCKPLWICVKLVTTTWLSPPLRKKLHGNTLRYTWDTVILLKTA